VVLDKAERQLQLSGRNCDTTAIKCSRISDADHGGDEEHTLALSPRIPRALARIRPAEGVGAVRDRLTAGEPGAWSGEDGARPGI
jgi:hypothetical protein